jgi:hypothetical protein
MQPEQARAVMWDLRAWPCSEDREVVTMNPPTGKTPPSATRNRRLTIATQHQEVTNLPQDRPA